ncbi:MAG: bifunctional oligoribonuclease/PAP phosphatase NrnA [candidate division Zixibacteria bacterium]|nr:bifunctional oligoribonuclease/PAP phosphatase NrnA [candidate division Zixibacteria bacterium]
MSSQTMGNVGALQAEINDLLKKSVRVLVVSHIDPDGDAIGSQLAFASYLRWLGKDVVSLRDSALPDKYRFLQGSESIVAIDDFVIAGNIDTAIVLECPNLDRAGRVGSLIGEDTTIINIDHHADNDKFGRVNWIDPGASSVGEMIYDLIAVPGYQIDTATAEQIYTAILTDTGRFRFSSTSPKAFQIASELVAAGADPQKICDSVYYNMRPSAMRLIGKVLNSIEFHRDGAICLLKLTRDMLQSSGAEESDSDGLVDFALFSKGVRVGALLKEAGPETTRVSFRSRDGINVAELAARFGGGGHVKASGCTLKGGLQDSRKVIIKMLEEAVDG